MRSARSLKASLVLLLVAVSVSAGQVPVIDTSRISTSSPLEITSGTFRNYLLAVTISPQALPSTGNRMDVYSLLNGDPENVTRTQLPTATSDLFSLTKTIEFIRSGDSMRAVFGAIDGFCPTVWETMDGLNYTKTLLATSRVHGEMEMAQSSEGLMVGAYNAQRRKVDFFFYGNVTQRWESYGSYPEIGMINGAVFNGFRIGLSADKKSDEPYSLFGLIDDRPTVVRLAPEGGKMVEKSRYTISFLNKPTATTESQLVSTDYGVAGITINKDRYSLFSVRYDSPGAGQVQELDLGEAPTGRFSLGMTIGGGKTLYPFTERRDRSAELRKVVIGPDFRLSLQNSWTITLPPPTVQVTPVNIHRISGMMADGWGYGLAGFYTRSLDMFRFRGCVNGNRTLCSTNNRFDISVRWRTSDGTTGTGRAVPLTNDTGYFWFFNENNIEMVIKVLNGCGLNQRFWVFAGGLTDVEVEITVRDTETGAVKTYTNPLGRAFQPIQDTSAFAGCPAGKASLTATLTSGPPLPRSTASATCTASDTALCLAGDRFRVEANWVTRDGASGQGKAVRLTDDSGYFWFFGSDNVELIAKVLNACSFNRYWVFAGGLTDVQVEMIVTDTTNGAVKRYQNPIGTAFQPIQDTSAFATCP